MVIAIEEVGVLAELTALPGEWVRQWATGRGRRELDVARPVKAMERVSLIEVYLHKVDLDALPGRRASSN